MFDYKRIKRILKSNDELIILNEKIIKDTNPYKKFITYNVAPKKGLYEVKELQDFMLNLIPEREFKSYFKDDFYETDKFLFFGRLYFDGQTDLEDFIRVIINVYPDEEIGKDDAFSTTLDKIVPKRVFTKFKYNTSRIKIDELRNFRKK